MYIHQIWLQGVNNIPSKYIENMNLITSLNPNYTHIVWSEETFYKNILNNNKYDNDFLNTSKIIYAKLTLIHLKVDYIRYIILYLLGGIYVDMDVKNIKSFDNITHILDKYDCILDQLEYGILQSLIISDNKRTLNNGVIVIKYPKNNFIKKLINSVNDSVVENENKIKLCIERTHNSSIIINEITGPKKFTNVYNSLSLPEKNKIYITKNKEFFCTHNCNTVHETTILKHTSDLTWFGTKYHRIIRLYLSKDFEIMCMILFIIMIISLVLANVYISNYITKVVLSILISIILAGSIVGLMIKLI